MERTTSQAEKTGLLASTTERHELHHDLHHDLHKTRRAHRRAIKGMVLAILLFGWWSYYAIPSFLKFPEDDQMEAPSKSKLVDFEDIIPSEKLEWHPCFTDRILCARLTVPMDYNRPLNASDDNPKVHIALLMVPGKHTGSQNYSTSPLLLNPGGPGGSGFMIALALGDKIQKIVGEDQDVIGFDPRGIGATMPRADCFSYPLEEADAETSFNTDKEDYVGGNFHRMMWSLSGKEIGLVNSSSRSLHKLDTRARALAKLCTEKDSLYGKDSILKYAHTPSVARDMISIIDAWDAWTESEKDTSLSRCGRFENVVEDEQPADLHEGDVNQVPDTKGKLVYWGFSYGTLLGATFAAMFPDRVGRVVLDGVVDADHYGWSSCSLCDDAEEAELFFRALAPIWRDSIRDADKISDSFATYCHEAGDKCALYRPGDKPSDIDARFWRILAGLKDNPITGIGPTKTPVIVSHSDVRMLLFASLYAPMIFPIIATLFDLVEKGLGELLAQFWVLPGLYDLKPLCTLHLPAWVYPTEAQVAIMCSDKRYPLDETLPGLETMFEKMNNLSSWADVWMTVMIGCEGWKIEAVDPPMRWDDHPAHKQKPIKTSHPLLFISNTADPVTPLKAGVKMAKKFVDAGLLEQQSEGHCSLAAVSKCTVRKVRAYFTTGEVPPPPQDGDSGEWSDGKWEKCEADEWPFHPYTGEDTSKTRVESAAEAERIMALKEMQQIFTHMKQWGRPDVAIDTFGLERHLRNMEK